MNHLIRLRVAEVWRSQQQNECVVADKFLSSDLELQAGGQRTHLKCHQSFKPSNSTCSDIFYTARSYCPILSKQPHIQMSKTYGRSLIQTISLYFLAPSLSPYHNTKWIYPNFKCLCCLSVNKLFKSPKFKISFETQGNFLTVTPPPL